jgi:KaiC/GvpD/RAD55 family RecA-like ATPase
MSRAKDRVERDTASTNGYHGDRQILVVAASEVTPRPVEWLWDGRIPRGCVTLIAGAPGLGKSQLVTLLAAQLSRGTLEGDLEGKRAASVLCSAEDALKHTAAPRLMAADADRSRVVFTGQVAEHGFVDALDLQRDLNQLTRLVKKTKAALLAVDPFVSFVSDIDAHQDAQVRRALAGLAAMAEETDLAVVGVMHFNKRTSEADALNRISGSIAWGALARSALMLGRDDTDTLHLVHIKSNLSVCAPSQVCRIEPITVTNDDDQDIPTSRLVLEGDSDVQAHDLLTAAPSAEERTLKAEAGEWLKARLADGPVPSNELYQEGDKQGFSTKTLHRAKEDTGVVAKQTRDGWCWELPDGTEKRGKKSKRRKAARSS